MAMKRLMAAARAAGCAMAPSLDELDGPNNVMPRPVVDYSADADTATESTALAVRWQEPAITTRVKDLVGHLWYGRATPA